ncbi:MAG: alpha/beta hydrolase [Chloroflexota bacterium]
MNCINNGAHKWYFAEDREQVNGVALVIHGLNFRPAKMDHIINLLTQAGIDVLALSLRGHGDNFERKASVSDDWARMQTLRAISYELWRDEVYHAYELVVQYSQEHHHIPVFFVGYSMGALLVCDLLQSNPHIHFDKMILFSPSLAVHWYTYAFNPFKALRGLTTQLSASIGYRANTLTGTNAFRALYQALDHFHKNLNQNCLNIPTLVFMDPEDELVSYRKVKRLIEDHDITQWQLTPLVKQGNARRYFHHLVINPHCVGEETWADVSHKITVHLQRT